MDTVDFYKSMLSLSVWSQLLFTLLICGNSCVFTGSLLVRRATCSASQETTQEKVSAGQPWTDNATCLTGSNVEEICEAAPYNAVSSLCRVFGWWRWHIVYCYGFILLRITFEVKDWWLKCCLKGHYSSLINLNFPPTCIWFKARRFQEILISQKHEKFLIWDQFAL